MDDRTYSVRLSTEKAVNPFDLDLRSLGQLRVLPGREYFFENAPIQFINYVVQLALMGVTYRLTDDKKGCFYTVDLTGYNRTNPRMVASRVRKMENPVIHKPIKVEEPAAVVLSSDDLVPREGMNEVINKEVEVPVEIPTIPEPIVEEFSEENREEIKDEVVEEVPVEETKEIPKYTDSELSKLGKVQLLEIASSLELTNISDINTKKEIREAILAKQSE